MGALADDNKVAYSEANYSTIYTENEVKNTVYDRIEWTKSSIIHLMINNRIKIT